MSNSSFPLDVYFTNEGGTIDGGARQFGNSPSTSADDVGTATQINPACNEPPSNSYAEDTLRGATVPNVASKKTDWPIDAEQDCKCIAADINLADLSIPVKLKTVKFFRPCKDLIIPNDKITNALFALKPKTYNNMTNNDKQMPIHEGYAGKELKDGDNVVVKKGDSVRSLARLKIVPCEYSFDIAALNEPLNYFDRLIMSCIASNFKANNRNITISTLWRDICGKTGKVNTKTDDLIYSSLTKLSSLRIELDLSNTFRCLTDKRGNLKYNDGKPLKIDFTPLIDISFTDGLFCGKKQTIITINSLPILYKIAFMKNRQMLTVPLEVLKTVDRYNTSDVNFAVKFYTLIRAVEEFSADTILSSKLFTKCNLFDENGNFKRSLHFKESLFKAIRDILDNLQSIGRIKSFDFKREGKSLTKITISKNLSKKSVPIRQG